MNYEKDIFHPIQGVTDFNRNDANQTIRRTASPELTHTDLAGMLNREAGASIQVIMGLARVLGLGSTNREELKSFTETICAEGRHLLYLLTGILELPSQSEYLTCSRFHRDTHGEMQDNPSVK